MYNNQLDFSNPNQDEYFIYQENEDNGMNDQYISNPNYIEDLRSKQIEAYIMNEGRQYDRQPNFEEQLEYKAQTNENILPQAKPNAMYYNPNLEQRKHAGRGGKKKTNVKKNWTATRGKAHMKSNYWSKPEASNSASQLYLKASQPNKQNNRENYQEPSRNFAIGSALNQKGLFDPHLKKNELDYPSRTQIQRTERLEKIKNYEVKFGKKIKNIQMYGNYVDLLEDVENIKAEKDSKKRINKLGKSKYKNYNPGKSKAELTAILDMIPKPKICFSQNNLDFNFSKYEDMIKSLEEQIEYERKLRSDINMKYFDKMKEFEDLKYQSIAGPTRSKSSTKIGKKNKKVRKLFRNYSGSHLNYSKYNARSSRFKRDLQKSATMLKKTVSPSSKRMNSVDKIKEKARMLARSAERQIDKDFGKLYKQILQKNKTLVKNVYSSASKGICQEDIMPKTSSVRMKGTEDNHHSSNVLVNSTTNENVYASNYYPPKEETGIEMSIDAQGNIGDGMRFQNQNAITSPMSINLNSPMNFSDTAVNMQSPYANPSNNFGISCTNQSKKPAIVLDSSKIDLKIASEILSHCNLEKFEKMNKFEMLASLNNEIDRYNQGLPNLVEKVEQTIEKINKVNIFDEKTHPIIKMASKSAGQIVQLHMDEIVSKIIDDLLIECVYELQDIEDRNTKKTEKENFVSFVSDYYKNFKNMKFMEEEIVRRIDDDSKSKVICKPYIPFNKTEKDYQVIRKKININEIEYKNPFESGIVNLTCNPNILSPLYSSNHNLFISPDPDIYTNYSQKFSVQSKKFSAKIHKKLQYKIEKYSKDFFEHLKVTGNFYYPNIFGLYDEFVKQIVDEMLDQEMDYCLKQVDNFVHDLYHEEMLNIDTHGAK